MKIKSIAIAAVLSLTSMAAQAKLHNQAHLCWIEGNLAGQYIELRNLGATKEELLIDAADQVIRGIIEVIYSVPPIHSEEMQRKVKTQFFKFCIEREFKNAK